MKEYSISVPDGMATTVLLSDDDAKRAGLLSDDGKVAKSADPSKQPEVLQAQKDEAERQKDAAAANTGGNDPANKQGTTENK